MIQLAAAFHHHARGNFAGAKSLLEAGLDKLAKFPSEHRGVNLAALRDVGRRWLDALARDGENLPCETPHIEFAGQIAGSEHRADGKPSVPD